MDSAFFSSMADLMLSACCAGHFVAEIKAISKARLLAAPAVDSHQNWGARGMALVRIESNVRRIMGSQSEILNSIEVGRLSLRLNSQQFNYPETTKQVL
jgi:hypothetical protein